MTSCKRFQPFYDVLTWVPKVTIPKYFDATGGKDLILAFVHTYSLDRDLISWGGYGSYAIVDPANPDDAYRQDEIAEFRSKGGDIGISIGGENGALDVFAEFFEGDALVKKYQDLINVYKLKRIDFDIEGAAVRSEKSIKRRSKALKQIAIDNPGIEIGFTLPVNTTGLTADGLKLMQIHFDDNSPVHLLNGMSMEFNWYHTDGDDMSTTIIKSLKGQKAQMDAMGWGPELKHGTNPLIGKSNAPKEVIYQADVKRICEFINANDWAVSFGFWHILKDNGDCPGGIGANPVCSGIVQEPWEFSKLCVDTLDLCGTVIPPPIDKDCDPGYHWDEDLQKCVEDIIVIPDCPDGYIRNPDTGLCEEIIDKDCSPGYHWDEDLQRCVKDVIVIPPIDKSCDPGFHWDEDLQRCVKDVIVVPPIDKSCDPGFHWDEDLQSCVKDVIVVPPTPEPTPKKKMKIGPTHLAMVMSSFLAGWVARK